MWQPLSVLPQARLKSIEKLNFQYYLALHKPYTIFESEHGKWIEENEEAV